SRGSSLVRPQCASRWGPRVRSARHDRTLRTARRVREPIKEIYYMNPPELRSLTSGKSLFHKHESKVRSYARNFPSLFSRAEGAYLFDEQGKGYLDFLSGAGSLNYGHNHKLLREALVRYINE